MEKEVDISEHCRRIVVSLEEPFWIVHWGRGKTGPEVDDKGEFYLSVWRYQEFSSESQERA